MCGLIGIINKNTSQKNSQKVTELYEKQRERGYQGFGIVTIDEKRKITIFRNTTEVVSVFNLLHATAPIILFHHRYPTSTKNTHSQTHPIYLSHPKLKYDWLVAHNGVIRNAAELKETHVKKYGFNYTTKINKEKYYTTNYAGNFNDSEAYAYELVLFLERKKTMTHEGAATFWAVKINKKTGLAETIIFGKNTINPLKFKETKNEIIFASELPENAIEENTYYEKDLKDYFKNNKKSLIQKNIKYKPPYSTTSYHTGFITNQSLEKPKKPKKENVNATRNYNNATYKKTPDIREYDEAFEETTNAIIDVLEDVYVDIQTLRTLPQKTKKTALKKIKHKLEDLNYELHYAKNKKL